VISTCKNTPATDAPRSPGAPLQRRALGDLLRTFPFILRPAVETLADKFCQVASVHEHASVYFAVDVYRENKRAVSAASS
jgi:hypothetical protein